MQDQSNNDRNRGKVKKSYKTGCIIILVIFVVIMAIYLFGFIGGE
jgi:flagellar basal body-associated protein FliL